MRATKPFKCAHLSCVKNLAKSYLRACNTGRKWVRESLQIHQQVQRSYCDTKNQTSSPKHKMHFQASFRVWGLSGAAPFALPQGFRRIPPEDGHDDAHLLNHGFHAWTRVESPSTADSRLDRILGKASLDWSSDLRCVLFQRRTTATQAHFNKSNLYGRLGGHCTSSSHAHSQKHHTSRQLFQVWPS